MLFFPAAALAQTAPAGPPVAFAPVTAAPIPLQSTSGRFSSLNPTGRLNCGHKKVLGRVVSAHLIMMDGRPDCGQGQNYNLLVNVEFTNPADAAQMVAGRRVEISARFRSAQENRTARFFAEYLIADEAELVAGDPIDRSAPPPQPFTSYMLCQPPELDGLATKLGGELCVQNTILANLTATVPALETAARAVMEVSPDETVSGDPGTITCRQDPGVSGTRLPATACARNSYWAWYKEKWRDPFYPKPAPP